MNRKLLWVAIMLGVAAPGPARSAGTDALPVGRCINMGNHLEPPVEDGFGGRSIADQDFTIIARAGFSSVRLPVNWSAHAATATPYTIDSAFMARVQHVVSAARKAGLNVILNSHHFNALHSDPAGNAVRLAGLWRQIGAAFADVPREHLWFEIDNEPQGKLTNTNLGATLAGALAAIREANPDRPVIIGGENWSGIDSLKTLELPADPNVVPTFHYYEPFDFTHQGASWVNPPPPLGRAYGTRDDAERLNRDVQKVRDYVARTGKTPFIGETGAHTTAPLDQRILYHRAVREAFGQLDIGMCAWAYTNTFPFYDSKAGDWLPGLREAFGLAKN